MNKGELSITVVIGIAVGLLVLIILFFIINRANTSVNNANNCEKEGGLGGQCLPIATGCGDKQNFGPSSCAGKTGTTCCGK
jgi:hypothetical protein